MWIRCEYFAKSSASPPQKHACGAQCVPPARGSFALPQRGGDRVHRRWRRALREAKVALAVQAAAVVAGGVHALGGVRRREALRRVSPDDGAPPARRAAPRARRPSTCSPPDARGSTKMVDASAADHRRAARCAACDVRRRVQHRSRILLRRAQQHLRVASTSSRSSSECEKNLICGALCRSVGWWRRRGAQGDDEGGT